MTGLRKVWNPAQLVGLLRALLPSFVADAVWPELRPAWKLHPTSYLDGLRGIASFVVFFCHYTELRHGYFVPSYGLNDAQTAPSALIQLPYLRLVYSGRPMVHIFFVISGFVLSYKPLKLLHARQPERCYSALASSTFRRPIRLFLPCAVSTLGIAALAQGGFMYAPMASTTEQLRNWLAVFFHGIAWPWDWDRDLRPGYDIHLWTIPIEFAHSMLLFLALLGLSRLRTLLRQVATVLLVLYCMCAGKWAGFEFLAGLFLAELHVLKSQRLARFDSGGGMTDFGTSTGPLSIGKGMGMDIGIGVGLGQSIHRLPGAVRQMVAGRRRAFKVVLHTAIIVAALFVGGWPNNDADKTPGIRYLLAKTPTSFLEGDQMPQKFWFGVAAIGLVWSVGELDGVRRVFEGGLAQYAGRISYAIYIMHGPGLDYFQDLVLGWPAEPARGAPENGDFVPAFAGKGLKGMIGVATPAQRMMTWFAGLLILGPVVVWLADLFWRFVDAPIVSLGRTLELACLQPPEEQQQQRHDEAAAKERSRDGYALLG